MAVTGRTRRAGIAAVLALMIGGGGFAAGGGTAGPATAGPAAAGAATAGPQTAGPETASRPPGATAPRSGAGSYADVVRQVLPSVVLIRTPSGLGSGVVLDGRGNIVTNAHVAGGATSFQVQFAGDSQPRHARLVGSYAPGDLAVIRADDPSGLSPARFGDSGRGADRVRARHEPPPGGHRRPGRHRHRPGRPSRRGGDRRGHPGRPGRPGRAPPR